MKYALKYQDVVYPVVRLEGLNFVVETPEWVGEKMRISVLDAINDPSITMEYVLE